VAQGAAHPVPLNVDQVTMLVATPGTTNVNVELTIKQKTFVKSSS